MGYSNETGTESKALNVVALDSLKDKTIVIANNETGDMTVKIETTGRYHNKVHAMHLIGLWNEFHKLPHHLRLSAAMVFQMLKTVDEHDLCDEYAQLEDKIKSLKWWNNLYRWALFATIMGLTAYALIKH